MMSASMKTKTPVTPVEDLRLLLITDSLDAVIWKYALFCEVLYCWQLMLGRAVLMSAHVTHRDSSNNPLSSQHQHSQSPCENGSSHRGLLTDACASPLLQSSVSLKRSNPNFISCTQSQVWRAIKTTTDESWHLPAEGLPWPVDAPLWYQISIWPRDEDGVLKNKIRAREKARQPRISKPAPKPKPTGPLPTVKSLLNLPPLIPGIWCPVNRSSVIHPVRPYKGRGTTASERKRRNNVRCHQGVAPLHPPMEKRYYSPTDSVNGAGGTPELLLYEDASEPEVEESPPPIQPKIALVKLHLWPGIGLPDGPQPGKMSFWKRLFSPSVQEPSLQALKERHRAVMSTEPDSFVRAQLNKKMPYDLIKEEEDRRKRIEKEQVSKRKKREKDRKRKKKVRAKWVEGLDMERMRE